MGSPAFPLILLLMRRFLLMSRAYHSLIPFVEKIADGSQLVFTFVGVDVVRNSDQPNVVIGKELLGQSADLDVITPQAAEIFYKHCR